MFERSCRGKGKGEGRAVMSLLNAIGALVQKKKCKKNNREMSATVYFYVYGRYKTITLFFNSFSLKGYRRPPQNVHFCAEDRIVFGRDKQRIWRWANRFA